MLLDVQTKTDALVVPALVGATVGVVGGSVYWYVGSCPLECLETELLSAFFVPPSLLIAAGLTLHFGHAKRPWSTALLGTFAMLVVVACLGRITYSYFLITVIAGLAGFVWAALVVGPMLRLPYRLTVFVPLFALVATTALLDPVGESRRGVLRLESITVPLVAPEVPGFEVTYATGNRDANVFRLTLTRLGGQRGYLADEIEITGLEVPAGFDPPFSCGPVYWEFPESPPCDPAGPDLWRRSVYTDTIQYVVRRGRWIYIADGGGKTIGEGSIRLAATTLHPVSAQQLGRLPGSN